MLDRKLHPLSLCVIERFTDDEEEDLFTWKVYNRQNKEIGEFGFRRDLKDRLWINSCNIETQGRGIGSSIVKHAVSIFGSIYFCTTSKVDLIGGGRDYDIRYLTEEGVALMNSCLRKKIIKPEWCIDCR